MEFEYDQTKSLSNKRKHGVDFEEAQELWKGTYIVVPLGNGHGEKRQAVFGAIGEKHWTAIVTERGRFTRIISVRRSRAREEAYYEYAKEGRY